MLKGTEFEVSKIRHNQVSIKEDVTDTNLVSRGLQKFRCGEARVSRKESKIYALDYSFAPENENYIERFKLHFAENI